MNLKSCVTKPKNSKYYTPHKLRSRPLRCITFPVCIVFLFLLFWFIICPLLFVELLTKQNTWPKEWPFYFWVVALLIFLILLSILVCVWRCARQDDSSRAEADLLLNSASLKKKNGKLQELCVISLNTIQKSQDKLDAAPVQKLEKQQNCNANISNGEEILTKRYPKNENLIENNGDTVFRRCSIVPKLEKEKDNSHRIVLPALGETRAEIHSASPPLTPREIFFWDLIESANQSRNSGIYDFIEHEKEYSSLDNCATPVSDPVQIRMPQNNRLSSAEYFIANVPDRKSLTAEIFLYIDGGQQEKSVTIRTNPDGDDDVFTN